MAIGETYEEFVEKFKPKKTTDDCYTPPEVYRYVLDYVGTLIPLEGMRIERPFYPGGDYRKAAEGYDERTVVIDNPPFSILAEIKGFYLERGIRFFLFSPHLTLFSSPQYHDRLTYILCKADIVYENGAKVTTDFVHNFPGDMQVITASALKIRIEDVQKKEREGKRILLPKYSYPGNVFSSTMLDAAIGLGIDFCLRRSECVPVRSLDSQKKAKKTIFGGEFLISEEARKRAEEARKRAEEARKLVWELSEREQEIIRRLG